VKTVDTETKDIKIPIPGLTAVVSAKQGAGDQSEGSQEEGSHREHSEKAQD